MLILFALKAMDNLKKENFSLKLRIFYLQERLAKMGPANLETILNEVFLSSNIPSVVNSPFIILA